MESIKLYDKANSFIEIRHSEQAHQDILRRIGKVRQDLAQRQSSDYRSQIILQACDDLLSDPATDSKPNFYLREHVIEELGRVSDEEMLRYLFYRYRYEVFPQEKKIDHFAPCLQIEPTSICNYRCIFCYQIDKNLTRRQNGHMGMMSLELFKRVVDQAEGACEAVTLASRGEPLLSRDIDKMLAYLRGKFLALKINTNASVLDERKAHAILQAGFNTVVFSADAASEPLYSELRVKGKLDKVLANIERFQEIRTRHYSDCKTITRVSGVRYCQDQNIDDMERVWGNLVDQVAFVDYNPWENSYQRPINDITTPCSDLWRRMFVWHDGTVNPCDVDYLSTLAVGNANEESLSDIWTGKKYSALREAHLARHRGEVSPCNRCTLV